MGNRGVFITFEGGEGAGKSSVIKFLSNRLEEEGYSVTVTREPGGTSFGEKIRGLLLKNQENFFIGAKAELLLFLSARAQHIEERIIPDLEKGKIVLCDRFNDSTIAYQGAARNLEVDYVQMLCRLVCGKCLPDLTLYLDVDPALGLKRILNLTKEESNEIGLDRIESEAVTFHEQVREAFHLLVKREPNRIHSIDANQSLEGVFKDSWQEIQKYLFSH